MCFGGGLSEKTPQQHIKAALSTSTCKSLPFALMSFSFFLILAIKRRKGEKNLSWFSKNKKIFSYSNGSLLFSVRADLASSEERDQSFSKVRITLTVKHRLNVPLKKTTHLSRSRYDGPCIVSGATALQLEPKLMTVREP